MIGFFTRQFDVDTYVPGTHFSANQTDILEIFGRLKKEELTTVAARRNAARSYLDVNCSYCHKESNRPSVIDATYDSVTSNICEKETVLYSGNALKIS